MLFLTHFNQKLSQKYILLTKKSLYVKSTISFKFIILKQKLEINNKSLCENIKKKLFSYFILLKSGCIQKRGEYIYFMFFYLKNSENLVKKKLEGTFKIYF